MPFLASAAINHARDRHPGFTREQTPDGPAVRYLSEYVRQLHSRTLEVNPDAIVAPHPIPLPLAVFADGSVLPDHHYVHGGDVHIDEDDSSVPLHIIPWELRRQRMPWPAVTIHGGTLYQLGWEELWEPFSRIVLRLAAAAAAELSALADTVELPASAFPCCTAALAGFMAGRPVKEGLQKPDKAALIADRIGAEGVYLTEIGNKRRSQAMQIMEVW